MLKNAHERLHIIKKTSSSYHRQTSGLVEKSNTTLMKMLKKILNQGEDWDILLDEVLFSTIRLPKTALEDSHHSSCSRDSRQDL